MQKIRQDVWEYFDEYYYFTEGAADAAVEILIGQPEDVKVYLTDPDMVPMILEWLNLAPQHAVGYDFARAVAAMIART